MAITGAGLGAAIKAKLMTDKVTNEGELETFCTAIGEAVVEYLKANAQVIIPAAAIATTGSPESHTGPDSPLPLQIT